MSDISRADRQTDKKKEMLTDQDMHICVLISAVFSLVAKRPNIGRTQTNKQTHTLRLTADSRAE